MKRLFTIGTALSLTLALGACQDSEEGQDAEPVIAYDYFNMEVDYVDLEDAYAVEYEKEGDGLDAEIEDNITDKEYNSTDGSEAFDDIQPAFEQLDFDENTPDEEVAEQLVNAFNLREDYERIEFEVDFSEGGEKEFTIDNS
ncbi:MAG: YusW family protein [Bacillota bacterium]